MRDFNLLLGGNEMNIENTIKYEVLPVNSKAMVNRLIELMDEEGTNCLQNMRCDLRVKGVLWLLNQQVFGQLGTIDMFELWQELNEKL
jgi:hypothetical protein